jgi:hypothetical protein
MEQTTDSLPLLLTLAALIVVAGFWKKRKKRKTRRNLEGLCAYFDGVNSTRAFPTVYSNIHTKNEFGLINENANLYEVRAHRQSVGLSVRIVKGVWASRRTYLSKDHLDRTAVGTVVLTNHRLVFESPAKTVTVRLTDIISAQAGADCLELHSTKRQHPVILEFSSAELAALLIATFQRRPFQENVLPKDMTITATPADDGTGIKLAFLP